MSAHHRDIVHVVDSHTEGEPTRVVIEGWPQPDGATMAARRDFMRERQDALRRALILEPRGHSAIVGALLTAPVTPNAIAGVVFFNNVGYLNMCGHGLIGVVKTLAWMGRKIDGEVVLDTPVGPVSAVAARRRRRHDHQRPRPQPCPGRGDRCTGFGRFRATWPGAATGSSSPRCQERTSTLPTSRACRRRPWR